MIYTGKTLFINTGGTLSVTLNPNKKGLTTMRTYNFEHNLQKLFNNYSIIEPFSILSEQITLTHCKNILELLQKNQNYELIIVLHGTDRLTFNAQYLKRFYKPGCPILFLGCQRSPDMPTYELYGLLLKIVKFIHEVQKGIYVVNNKSNECLQLLEPINCQKLYSFRKDCFRGKILYMFTNTLSKLNEGLKRVYPLVEPNIESVSIFYLLPSFTYSIPKLTKQIIIVGTGLGNVNDIIINLAVNNRDVKFYVSTTLIGPKGKIYGSHLPSNIIITNKLPQLLYIDLIHNLPIKNNYGL
jgi:L-asparaginase/Glu-tRNA(Gln) amidotransferase subunit D